MNCSRQIGSATRLETVLVGISGDFGFVRRNDDEGDQWREPQQPSYCAVQAACLAESTARSHAAIWFQLANIRVTTAPLARTSEVVDGR
jgi:hypothetical protein